MGYGISDRIGFGVVVPVEPLGLNDVLDNLTSSQETVLIDVFLTPLATLETAVRTAADNLDTLKAGPWEANPNEVAARRNLFRSTCRELCAFLGFEPGPALAGGNSIAIVRG